METDQDKIVTAPIFMGRDRKDFNDEIWCYANVCNQEWNIQFSICKKVMKALKSCEPGKRR